MSLARPAEMPAAPEATRWQRHGRTILLVGGLLALLLVIPIGIDSDFVFHIFITICLYGALSTAWNIVGGYAGQLARPCDLYGIGAYTAGLLVGYGISPWFGMILGAGIAAVVGVAIALPCFRLRGPFSRCPRWPFSRSSSCLRCISGT